jgi:hypothetical protein
MACLVICLHLSPFCAFGLHPVIAISLKSSSTSAFHLILGLPFLLLSTIPHLGILPSSILSTYPSHLSRCILTTPVISSVIIKLRKVSSLFLAFLSHLGKGGRFNVFLQHERAKLEHFVFPRVVFSGAEIKIAKNLYSPPRHSRYLSRKGWPANRAASRSATPCPVLIWLLEPDHPDFQVRCAHASKPVLRQRRGPGPRSVGGGAREVASSVGRRRQRRKGATVVAGALSVSRPAIDCRSAQC